MVTIRLFHLGVETEVGYNFRGEIVSEETSGNGSGMDLPAFTNSFGSAPTGNASSASAQAEATPGGVLPVPDRSASYTYDKGGNRTSQTIDGVTTTFTYDSASRLVSESSTGRTVQHLYDEWGNETERTTEESSTTTVETYGYNGRNLMSSYVREVESTIVAEWQYDYWPTGERYAKTNLTTDVSQLYVSNGDNVVAEYNRTALGTITLQNTYAQGLGLDQKSLRIPASGGRIHYLGDMVGTVTATLDDSGLKSEECVRDAWGNTISGDTNNERYGFAQREHDTESGLVYMRHRMYDPRVGRFTQFDPIHNNRPGKHFLYGSNRPSMRTDPLGLDDKDWKEFLDSGKQLGIGFKPLFVARDTSLKWNLRNNETNHYNQLNNTIYLNPSFRDPKTGGLKRFADLTDNQIGTVYHELFHAAWDQLYEEHDGFNPNSDFYKESTSLVLHIREEESRAMPNAPWDQMKMGEEELAGYAGTAAHAVVGLKRAIDYVGRDSLIDRKEYDLLRELTKTHTDKVRSTKGMLEEHDVLAQYPTVKESRNAVTNQMARYVNRWYFNGMYDFLNWRGEPDTLLEHNGYTYDKTKQSWRKIEE